VTALPAAERGIGMVFQNYALWPHMTVRKNISYGLKIRKLKAAEINQRIKEVLDITQLHNFADRLPGQLSGGQQQRVAMARAWALQPQVLLLDEPTASLDPHAKREVEALIEEFASQPGAMTLIFASHNLGQVKRLASRVIYLEQGRVLADLPVHDFFNGPLLQTQYPQAHSFVNGETL